MTAISTARTLFVFSHNIISFDLSVLLWKLKYQTALYQSPSPIGKKFGKYKWVSEIFFKFSRQISPLHNLKELNNLALRCFDGKSKKHLSGGLCYRRRSQLAAIQVEAITWSPTNRLFFGVFQPVSENIFAPYMTFLPFAQNTFL